jgi:CRP-like cAMP-binding protein
MNSRLEILQRLPAAPELSPAFLEELATAARLVDLAGGQLLFREGTHNNELFLIDRGSIGLDMHVPGRGTTRILTLGAGEIVAWSAILGDGRMTTSALALEPSRLLALPAETLRAACAREPQLGYRFMQAMAQAVARRLTATRLQLLDLFASEAPALKG